MPVRTFVPRLYRILTGALCAWLLLAITGAAAPSAHGLALSLQQPLAVIPACDPITTNTTWTTGNVYVVQNCALIVQEGATLTIQPGVVVKFGGAASSGLRVNGRLLAQGSADQPVIFTSLADDSAGDDTNGNGPSVGAPGDWYGMVLTDNSETALTHTHIRYGGANAANGALDGWSEAQIEVKAGAQFTLTHSEVRAGGRIGIFLNGAGLTPTIQSVHIADHANTENAYRYALLQSTINMQPSYADLTFSGNTRNEVTIGRFNEQMTQDVTLGGTNFGADCGYTLCLNTVPAGRTLTVAPGTQLAFNPSFGIAVASGGTLLAEGTVSRPITFTSATAAAPLSGAAPLAGEWIGLWAQPGSTLRLDHCDISYGSDGNFGNGGLEIDSDDAQVQNCKIHHNKGIGLYLLGPSNGVARPVLTNVEVTDYGGTGVHLEARYGAVLSVIWEGGAISRNGWSGMSAYTSNSIISPTLSSLTIADNGALGDAAERRAGIYWNQHNVNPLLADLTLTGNVGAAVYWYCNGSITARDLAATGNGANELTLPGCDVSGGRQWDLGDAAIPVRVTGHINVTPNALLAIQPGTALRFDKNPYNSPTRLEVQDQAALNALGTVAQPVVFTAATATPGWWTGIEANNRAQLTLRHCQVGYGGNGNTAALKIRWGLSGSVPAANIQNCEIHHSSRKGVHFDFANFANTPAPIFRFNNLHDNAEEAVANWNAPPLDARENYWGDPTGPFHATQNPGGLGDNVGDNILFYPWLAAPGGGTAPGAMLISTGAPNQISPGETVDYAIQYLNEMTITVQSSILMLQLPQAAYFLEGTAAAVYWPDRHQVIWKLGDLPPGANGFVSARVKFQWGLAADYSDGSYTQFAGANYNAASLDVAEYNAYQTSAPRVTQIVELSAAEFAAVRATSAELEDLYKMALVEGYQYLNAARVTYADGKEAVNAALRTADRQYGRILSLGEGRALASTVGGGMTAVRDMTGGMTATLHTQTYAFWGSWNPEAGGDREGAPLRAGADCGEARCFANCMLKAKAWGAVARKVAAAVSWVIPPVGAAWTTYEAYDEITTYLECKDDCRMAGTRSNHCCTAGEVRWSPTGLKQQCAQYSCDAVGTWKPTPDIVEKCEFGERCVAGAGTAGGCKACEEDLVAAHFSSVTLRAASEACPAGGSTPRCRDLTVRQAKDPNAIYGPAGDLLPGQVVTYTITYENEGAGRAYGVYVVNRLPDVFNAGTLAFIHKTGTYLPETREIVWLVGELGPKAAADSTGFITYTVALTGGLASGTVVANQAVVTFPSVPEETPTNTWVNLVTPLVATPQTLSTSYMTPLPIVLTGREVSGLPLTFAVAEGPHGGTLSGTAPNLTYTPGANFTGGDSFTFRASNGATTSRPAQVTINVTPAGDTTPPQMLWSNPAAGAANVIASAAPVFTDTVGPAYAPVILIGVSEPLSPTTVNTATVTLARQGGAALAASVSFDGGANQIVLWPRARLADDLYFVAIATSIADNAGNRLTTPHKIPFTVGDPTKRIYLPLVLRN